MSFFKLVLLLPSHDPFLFILSLTRLIEVKEEMGLGHRGGNWVKLGINELGQIRAMPKKSLNSNLTCLLNS